MKDVDSSPEGRGSESARRDRPPVRPRGRAVELLDKLLVSNASTIDELASTLMVSAETIERYRSGRLAMPIERQLLLATFMIERVPAYARFGHLLRGQIRATIAFQSRETEIHPSAPPSPRWPV